MATEQPTDNPKQETKKKWKKKEIYRVSDALDDAHLLEKSRMWHAIFNDHVADISAFDANLNAAYALEWLSKIEEFEAHPTDETIMDGIQQKTADIFTEVKATRGVVDDLEYYVDKAFPDDGRKLLEFGFGKMRWGLSKGEGRWPIPALTMRKVVQSYLTELTTAGLPANLPTEFNAAIEKLGEAEVGQEYEKRLRIKATTDRIKMFNNLFAIHTLVRNAAYIVFRNNLVIAKQFDV